jgi:acyl-CoA thioester hydrolase
MNNVRQHTNAPLHRITLAVRWADMDAVGHVNNATYYTYFEQLRMSWYEHLGLAGAIARGGQGPVVVHTRCDYRRAIRYPATLDLHLYPGRLGDTSFEAEYAIHDAADAGVLYAEGAAVSVWVDHDSDRAVALPAGIRQALGET